MYGDEGNSGRRGYYLLFLDKGRWDKRVVEEGEKDVMRDGKVVVWSVTEFRVGREVRWEGREDFLGRKLDICFVESGLGGE